MKYHGVYFFEYTGNVSWNTDPIFYKSMLDANQGISNQLNSFVCDERSLDSNSKC